MEKSELNFNHGARLGVLLATLNVSKRELSNRMNVAASNVSHWLKQHIVTQRIQEQYRAVLDAGWCYEQVCLAEIFKFSTNVIGKLAYSTCYVPFLFTNLI